MTLQRGIRQAYLRSVTAPRRVRPGRRVRLRVVIERVLGPRRTLRLRVRIPRDAMPGRTRLVLTGTPADEGTDLFEGLFDEFDIGDPEADTDDPGPRSLEALVRRIRRVQRYDGVHMTLGQMASGGMSEDFGSGVRREDDDARVRVYRDRQWRISGRVATPVRVVAR